MNMPTVLSPWYVVQKFVCEEDAGTPVGIWYYSAAEDGNTLFVPDPKRAMMIQSLHTAVHIARAEGAEIRVLTCEDDAREFGRE